MVGSSRKLRLKPCSISRLMQLKQRRYRDAWRAAAAPIERVPAIMDLDLLPTWADDRAIA
jgi:hypothetical protein